MPGRGVLRLVCACWCRAAVTIHDIRQYIEEPKVPKVEDGFRQGTKNQQLGSSPHAANASKTPLILYACKLFPET